MNILRLSFIALIFLVSACVDTDFDEPPPTGVDPDIEVTHTIRQMMEEYPPNLYHVIEEDVVISGIVVADDRSGNYFRSVVIQDETAGIQVRMDATDLFNEYAIGRRLFIKCNGLTIGSFAELPQLGGGFERDNQGNIESIAGIPEVLLDEFIEKGQWDQVVEPKVIRVSELGFYDLNTLVRLENSQFSAGDVGQTFAIDTVTSGGTEVRQSVNRTLTSCEGEPAILVRTSGFANFANAKVPGESGSIVGIYSVFVNDKQIFMRNLDDIADMDQPRCGSSSVIQGLRASYAGSPTTIPNGTVFTAEVISDRTAGNINSRNIVVEDEEGYGIVVRLAANHNFNLGDVVSVDASNAELSDFNGLVQISNLDNLNVEVISEDIDVEPREVTVSEILANHDNLESTLIVLRDVTITGGATFAGTLTVSDATGSIPLFTFNSATFGGDLVPGGEVDLVAIVSDFNNPQLNMRNGADVEGGTGGGDPELVDISEIRALYSGSDININENLEIEGVVISDRVSENTTVNNLFVQDGSAGIVVRFTEPHNYDLGDRIKVHVLGQELSEFNGLLQVNDVPPENAENLGAGTLPTPRQATVQEILQNGEAWESTLVVINDATISGSSTFEGSTTVSDGTGNIPMFTRFDATFATQPVPGNPVRMTCVVSDFNGTQVFIRNLDDIE